VDKLKRLLPVAALVGLCALIFALRLHTYNEPLERDLTTYAVIAHEMLEGKSLYSDLWDHKPPAIHVTYAAAELVAGYGRNSIFLMNVVASIATLLACYSIGSAGGAGRFGGLTAAAVWTLVSGDLAIEGNQPNTEVFLNACLTTAFAIFVRSGGKGSILGFRSALVAGLLFGVASLYKQIAIVHPVLLGAVYVMSAPSGVRKRAFVGVSLIGAIGLVLWGLVLGYFAVRGHAGAFIDAVFNYNRWYSANGGQNSLVRPSNVMAPDVFTVIVCIGSLALSGMVLGLVFGPRRQWNLLIAFAIATEIAVLLPGGFFQHYYQLWLPPLAIGAGWTVSLLRRILPVSARWLAQVTSVVSLLTLAFIEAPCYRDSATIWSFKKYGVIFLETDKLARSIDNLLLPNETFYEWGNETGLYFTSRRRPPSGIILAYPTQDGPLASQLSRRLLDDLKQTQPELIVLSRKALERVGEAGPILAWSTEEYRPFSDTGLFLLFVRKGSRLDTQGITFANGPAYF